MDRLEIPATLSWEEIMPKLPAWAVKFNDEQRALVPEILDALVANWVRDDWFTTLDFRYLPDTVGDGGTPYGNVVQSVLESPLVRYHPDGVLKQPLLDIVVENTRYLFSNFIQRQARKAPYSFNTDSLNTMLRLPGWKELVDFPHEDRYPEQHGKEPIAPYILKDEGERVKLVPSDRYEAARWRDRIVVQPGWLSVEVPRPLSSAYCYGSHPQTPENWRGEWKWLNARETIGETTYIRFDEGYFRGRFVVRTDFMEFKIRRFRTRI